ncbi:hypothetical protein BT96DRAFT_918623 [Gymnopus androsaceus JB14]|uniref:Uncharacterized protein n=1 Tax=Gymnopus androsaceus JB14 TaxID=1447944 RepID=A0A6A4HVE0_9AGAR|nr:hypothetical protein BT96DRAFT_918623 [Gymnopus androsaceus JB14]
MSKLMMKRIRRSLLVLLTLSTEQRQISEEEGEAYSDADAGVEAERPDPEAYP